MINMINILYIVMTSLFFLIFVPFHRRRRRRAPTTPTHDNVTLQNLLNPSGVSLSDLLRSRAIPNQRLVRAFGLTNTFVSESLDIHKIFRNESLRLLAAAKQRGWKDFLNITNEAVASSLEDGYIGFDAYVQSVTLRIILVAVLDVGVGADALASGDVQAVSSLITSLWDLSKKPEPTPSALLEHLNSRLRRLVPDENQFPNPLDYVIPTWETLWRVVATTVAHAHGNSESGLAFADLYDHPTAVQFRARKMSGAGPSAEEWVKEAMRLYPPVRHIHRAVLQPPHYLSAILPSSVRSLLGTPVQIKQADIESAQRFPEMWGSDAAVFDPARYQRQNSEEAPPLLAFGYGPLRCVAKEWAPMAAGIIVAAILDGVSRGTFDVIRGREVGRRSGWEGWRIERRG